ncbi:MAG: hypothetical protein KIT43_07965 [Bauldia sp.]|nr:hypothetical protein [Bauldia sp.]MCW5719095.1 hypothetical protein [Bauldia sp.]
MTRIAAAIAAIALVATPVFAQHVAEIEATDEQRTLIDAAIGVFGCELREDTIVEWEEDAGIFEVDDTICAFGQYDIKLDADYNIRSLTFDGPIDAMGAPAIMATPAEIEAIAAVLSHLGCEINPEAGVEKETADMYELDDVACSNGQFDIKMDGFFTIMTMTRD